MTNIKNDNKQLELGKTFSPKFNADGLIPVIVQDSITKTVLMFAYMNATTLQMTLDCREMIYYSRSRQQIWHKGKISGSVQKVVSLKVDCDQDVLLATVKPKQQGACHNGYESCFYRDVKNTDSISFNDTQQCFASIDVYEK